MCFFYPYKELANKIKFAIFSRTYLLGSKLPSVRELACKEELSITTIQRAFYELEQEGLICKKQRLGQFA